LCCLDQPLRGIGQHCLKYNYSTTFNAYQIISQSTLSRAVITVKNGNTTENITLTSLIPQYITNTVQATLFGGTTFYLDTSLNIAAAQSANTLPTSIDSWFFLPPHKAVGITGSSWRWLAKCYNKLHDLTQTDPSNPQDQFGIFQVQYNLKQMVPMDIVTLSTDVISQQTVNLLITTKNQQSNTVRVLINGVQ